MNILLLLIGLVAADGDHSRPVKCEGCYNILSLDGGRYNGLMTARFVDFMETKAYFIAKREFKH